MLPPWEHGRFFELRIFSRHTLVEFWRKHPNAEQPLRLWFSMVERAAWSSPAQVRAVFGSATSCRTIASFSISRATPTGLSLRSIRSPLSRFYPLRRNACGIRPHRCQQGLSMLEPIVDSVTHKKALRRIEKLWDAKPGSRQERELDALATLVDAYERRAFPIHALTPIEAITTRCEQIGWSRKDLEPLIGSRARVSEVLTGRRQLTLPMIRSIHQALGIPAEILISEPRPHQSSPRGRRSNSQRGSGSGVVRAAQHGVAADGRARVRSPAR